MNTVVTQIFPKIWVTNINEFLARFSKATRFTYQIFYSFKIPFRPAIFQELAAFIVSVLNRIKRCRLRTCIMAPAINPRFIGRNVGGDEGLVRKRAWPEQGSSSWVRVCICQLKPCHFRSDSVSFVHEWICILEEKTYIYNSDSWLHS